MSSRTKARGLFASYGPIPDRFTCGPWNTRIDPEHDPLKAFEKPKPVALVIETLTFTTPSSTTNMALLCRFMLRFHDCLFKDSEFQDTRYI